MSTETTNIRAEVARIAEHASVTYTTTYLGQRKRDGWDCDAWVCSLILDSGASTQSFASWCDELGYDSDSRKALAIYEACQCNADKLRRIFGVTGIVALQTALEGY